MALLNAGRQNVIESKLIQYDDIDIMSATSDYIIIDIKNNNYQIGNEIKFNVEYEALLNLMTSPFISKIFL